MTRPATIADIPRMTELGRRFHAYAGLDEVAFDDKSFADTIKAGIASDWQAYFVAEVDGQVAGMTGGVIYPSYFNHSGLAGQEMFWWAEKPGIGKSLYQALEQWAKDKGCKAFTMVALHDGQVERMDKLYRSMGYRPSEHSYIKGF